MKSQLRGVIISNYKQDDSFVFVDMSIYNEILSITETSLKIFRPYNPQPTAISYNPKANTLITTKELGLSNTIEQIPCGLYKITQSICPHDKLYNVFWYVHVGGIKQKIAKLYCQNNYDEGKLLSEKLESLEALALCMTEDSEKRILGILETLDCGKKVCETNTPMNKIILIQTCGCKKTTCNSCNKH